MGLTSKQKHSKKDAHFYMSILFQSWISQEKVEPKSAISMADFFVQINRIIRKHY